MSDFKKCPECGHILGTYMACRRCLLYTKDDEDE